MGRIVFVLCLSLLACGGGSSESSPSEQKISRSSIIGIAEWETAMLNFGENLCQRLEDNSASFDQKLVDTYYDAEWVFYQIADYTGDAHWEECAQRAERIYRDGYVLPNRGVVPGFWNFSRGLTEDFLRTGDSGSKEAALLLAHNASFAADTTPLEATINAEMSREVAYSIKAYLDAEDLGEPRRLRLPGLVDQALAHIDQWFVSGTAAYVRPFMVGLTAHALIDYYERTGDARIVPALTLALDKLWDKTWDGNAAAFRYTDRNVASGGTEPAPDLNLLIAPAYAWAYRQTGEPRFADRADQIFYGGVFLAFLNNGKQFNQNYRWSFEFVRWR